jgi:two-component system, chemotaxis family, protein-glutamate methylesterase/glutaminase
MIEHRSPLVCLGASAGGVDAFTRFLRVLRPDLGCAFVVITHLRRTPMALPEILRSATSMRVLLITDGMLIERNHVYVIPSNCELTLQDEHFHLAEISKPFGWPRVLTVFLKSMAEHWMGRPVAVVLSGADSDGSEALESIKAAGGVTFVQKRETAEHPDMPQNALATGFVDFELSPEEIAQEMVRIGSGKTRCLKFPECG